jgi:putative redox protein
MYAERKGWRLGEVMVRLKLFREEVGLRVERDVAVGGEPSDDQRARLADICERTPVTLALKGGIEIGTTLRLA